MKVCVVFLFLIVFILPVSGQGEKEVYKKAVDGFESNYNADRYEDVFSGFSTEMQKALPAEKTKEFLTGLKQQAGKITRREFLRYEHTAALYKTNFEKALFIVSISVDDEGKINGIFIKPYTEINLPKIERNLTAMILPFRGVWTVFWGGDTKETNYHVGHPAQKNAFDFVITNEKGSSYRTDGKTNEDYYAFGKEIIAPCDGKVVLAVDGIKDNVPGVMNPAFVPGNAVMIQTANQEYLLFGHFKQHSVAVEEGQTVKQGQLLGLCGNSGNSSEAHLHFHIQNAEDLNFATGVKCYFDNILVNGQVKTDYSPIRKEKVENGRK